MRTHRHPRPREAEAEAPGTIPLLGVHLNLPPVAKSREANSHSGPSDSRVPRRDAPVVSRSKRGCFIPAPSASRTLASRRCRRSAEKTLETNPHPQALMLNVLAAGPMLETRNLRLQHTGHAEYFLVLRGNPPLLRKISATNCFLSKNK